MLIILLWHFLHITSGSIVDYFLVSILTLIRNVSTPDKKIVPYTKLYVILNGFFPVANQSSSALQACECILISIDLKLHLCKLFMTFEEVLLIFTSLPDTFFQILGIVLAKNSVKSTLHDRRTNQRHNITSTCPVLPERSNSLCAVLITTSWNILNFNRHSSSVFWMYTEIRRKWEVF